MQTRIDRLYVHVYARMYVHLKRQVYALLLQLNTGQTEGPRGKDLNVEPVWMQGVTGSGVVVAFVDNGTVLSISHI